jgi:spermidine synthase
MPLPLLYTVAAISGACVLAIEILGTRLLGPYYGMGLFLWSALISVTLAALAVGYALGGRWADRDPRPDRLAVLLAGAGAWLLVVPWARHPLLAAADGLGLRAAVLSAATILFFPPLLLLGMIAPFAIRLRARDLSEVGRAAGDLSSLSTVASVAGALATGFWLVPTVGVTRLTLGVGLVLLATAALVLAFAGRSRGVRLTALLPIGLGAAALGMPGLRPAERVPGLREIAESAYAELRVLDRNGARILLIDGGVHTMVRIADGRPLQNYVVVSELAQRLFDRPGDLLLVGLGGGAAARTFARAGWRVEAVEIDSVVTRMARRHFGLDDAHARVHHADGRKFLATTEERYDLVFLDAFGSSAIPFHLVTVEAFRLARTRLRPGGVLVLNVEAVGWHDRLVHGVGVTLGRVFPHVAVLPIAEPPDRLGNVVLLAADRPLEIAEDRLENPVDYLADGDEHWRVVQRLHAWDNRFAPDPARAHALTDELNPVDVWAEQINHRARRELHAWFGARGGSW